MANITDIATRQTVETKHLTCAETAQLIREALKASFPGVKFSVTSKTYSGGASITVRWTDGPTSAEVNRVAGSFEGASFDGMIDLKSYHVSVFNGQPVHFGADFVFCNRTVSADLMRRAVRHAAVKYGWTVDAAAVVGEPKFKGWDADLTGLNTPAFDNGWSHDTKADLVRRIVSTMRPNGVIVNLKAR